MLRGIAKNIVTNAINSAAGHALCKNTDSIICASNDQHARFLGFQNPYDLIGKSVFDLSCAEFAYQYIDSDQKALSGKIWKGFELIRGSRTDVLPLYTQKMPIIENETIVGIFINCVVVNSSQLNLLNREIEFFEKLIGHKKQKPLALILAQELEEYRLTKREVQCLYYLLRGKSMREIAIILNRSRRTIEKHIENIKLKFNCSKKSELIAKTSIPVHYCRRHRITRNLSHWYQF